MVFRLLASLVCAAACAAIAAPSHEMPSRAFETRKAAARPQFKAPALAASLKIALPRLAVEKVIATASKPNEPMRIGSVRELEKSSAVESWTAIEGGFVSRAIASSEGALGIRVKLELSGLTSPIEVRVQGNDGRVEMMTVDASRTEAWTPWTEGAEQMIEVFSATPVDTVSVRVGSIVHFTDSPFAKAASSCTISTACSTGDASLDAAMAERKKSVARIQFQDGGSAYLCSGTLINTDKFPSPFFMTAHHCVNNQPAASTLTTFWFYEDSACGSNIPNPNSQQVASGAELVMTNYNLDGTLLLLNAPPPDGAVYSGWDNTEILPSTPTFNISHPKGDTSRWATGFFTSSDGRINGPVQQFNVSSINRGFIEGGSSGSALFTLAKSGSFQLRGTLLGTYLDYACGNAEGNVIYSRFDIFEPQIDQYIRNTPQAPDDAPNRARDYFNTGFADPNGVDKPLNERTDTLALDNRRIDYVGDIDVYRFRLTSPAWVSTWTEGPQDTVGSILDSRGVNLQSNDDWQVGAPYNFGITKYLPAGTYYVQVGHFDPTGTGAYNIRMRADNVDTNYTALWWNANESGWGLNINHQGNILFGTLYTYDANGKATWFSMSNGAKQADGSYSGELVSSTGPAFNSSPWNPNAVGRSVVGTMRISFTDDNNGTLTYNVGPAQVTKSITRLNFKTPPSCTWSASNRSQSANYTDLWWGGAPESGWGVNLVHQSGVIFATLFTYDASGQPLWLVMSDGEGIPGSTTYTGPLYRTTGPAFNAVPFTPITAANNTQVGTMTLKFDVTNGDAATMTYTVNGVTVTKSIQRLEIAPIKPLCTQQTQ
jgi:lysyl endopeptidase